MTESSTACPLCGRQFRGPKCYTALSSHYLRCDVRKGPRPSPEAPARLHPVRSMSVAVAWHPCGLNQINQPWKKHKAVKAIMRSLLEAELVNPLSERGRCVSSPVEISITVGPPARNRLKDLDNLIGYHKIIRDALVQLGIIAGDTVEHIPGLEVPQQVELKPGEHPYIRVRITHTHGPR